MPPPFVHYLVPAVFFKLVRHYYLDMYNSAWHILIHISLVRNIIPTGVRCHNAQPSLNVKMVTMIVKLQKAKQLVFNLMHSFQSIKKILGVVKLGDVT